MTDPRSPGTVRVRYVVFGSPSAGPGGDGRDIDVPPNLAGAVEALKADLRRGGFTRSHMLYLNDEFVPSLLRRSGDFEVREGDEFRVIPVVAGG